MAGLVPAIHASPRQGRRQVFASPGEFRARIVKQRQGMSSFVKGFLDGKLSDIKDLWDWIGHLTRAPALSRRGVGAKTEQGDGRRRSSD